MFFGCSSGTPFAANDRREDRSRAAFGYTRSTSFYLRCAGYDLEDLVERVGFDGPEEISVLGAGRRECRSSERLAFKGPDVAWSECYNDLVKSCL